MQFLHITERILDLYPIHVFKDCNQQYIQDVALLDTKLNSYNRNTLYFGYRSQLADLSSYPEQCILAEPAFSSNQNDFYTDFFKEDNISLALIKSEDFFAVFNFSKNLIENSRSDNFYKELITLADNSHSLEAVLNTAAVLLGNCLIFSDMNFKIIASSSSIPVTDPLWIDNIRQGYCSYEFIQAVKELEPIKHAVQTTVAVEVNCPESPHRKLSSKVFHNGIQIGFILMIEKDTSIIPVHKDMLSTLSLVLTYTLKSYYPDFFQGPSPYQQILYDMLIGTPISEISPRLRNMSFPEQMTTVFIIPTQYFGRVYLRDHISKALKRAIPEIHVTYHKNGIAAVIGFDDSVELPQNIFLALEQFAIQEHVKIGIGNAFSNIESFTSHFEQAYQALEIGQRFDPDKFVYRYVHYQIFSLFYEVHDPDILGSFCHPALAILRQYDLKNNTQLYDTLHVYLDSGCSIKDAAAILYIHRNTFVYRLNKIAEICEIDLKDTNTCLLLRLSYLIDKFKGLD